ncbi:MAG: polyprenyl synthetase family protein [Ruminococcaceae bacterium]|nr:polyprenyl synthetase family protein [Oscillospiraceae bacterium]
MNYKEVYEECRRLVEEELDTYFEENCPQGELLEAMRYSLLAGGKRIRPILVLQFCAACGGDVSAAMPAACAIEMLHTYSLIHDDLPCMDNDDLRRGKPTCHVVYGETNAVLAGDALQASAFRTVLQCPVSADKLVAMASVLADAAGEQGMCGGQYLDISHDGEASDEESLRYLHALKTGALLEAACLMGAYCGGASEEQIRAASQYARNLGIAFQIRDDVLDITATTEELGKPVGSDAENGKTTFITLLGVDGCDRLVREYTEAAKAAVISSFPDSGLLCWLADELANRRK